MWKQIVKFSNFRDLRAITTRAYLTEAYKLNQEWDQRLKTPLLEKVNPETLFVDLSSKFQQKRKISAIDVDIYCNKVSDKNFEEAMDLAYKLRKTEQTAKMLDSTPHAVIRLLAEHPENLMTLLNHRLDYGVFLDSHAANILLDKFINEKNYMVAARLATFQMLQEDFEHPITRYLSLFACYKFIDDLQIFTDLIPPPPPEPEPQATGKSKKKIEEIKIRVRYLRNEYFDNHFDITNTNHLLGKTLLYLADEVQSVDEVLANSLQLVGYALYEKYEDGNKFVGMNKPFYKEVVDKVKALAEKAEKLDSNEEGKKFFDSLNNIATQKEGKVDEIIEGFIKKAVSENESKDIEEQKKVYHFIKYI
jgi:small subunit ribosomal protein S27